MHIQIECDDELSFEELHELLSEILANLPESFTGEVVE